LDFEGHVHRFDWSPGIGDPTFVGWLTVVLYLLTAWFSWQNSRLLTFRDLKMRREVAIWRVIAVLFLFLGINKQLDLQTAFTEFGRVVAHAQGWYDRRIGVQIAFIEIIALVCGLASLLLAVQNVRTRWPNWLAVFGTILVLGYVVIRAASFHHIDWFIHQRLLGIKWNWILEVGGISLVLYDAVRRYRSVAPGGRIRVREPQT
jgi:hypothetical protein